MIEIKNHHYSLSQSQKEIEELKIKLNSLQAAKMILEIENKNLKSNNERLTQSESFTNNFEEKKESLEKDKTKLQVKHDMKRARGYTEEESKNLVKSEETIQKLRNCIDEMKFKIERVGQIERTYNSQCKYIRILEEDIHLKEIEMRNIVENSIVDYSVKCEDYKKKMMNQFSKAKKNMEKTEIETKYKREKLTQMHSHQLLLELENYSRQIERLLIKNKDLENKVAALQCDITVYKEIVETMTKKKMKFVDFLKMSKEEKSNKSGKLEKNIEVLDTFESLETKLSENILLNKEKPFNRSRNKFSNRPMTILDSNHDSQIEKSVKDLTISNNIENQNKKLVKELNELKKNFETFKENVIKMEKKFQSIYKLFDSEIQRLILEDKNLSQSENVIFNFEKIKNADFSALSIENQYSILKIIIKFILPLINLKDLDGSNSQSKMLFQYNCASTHHNSNVISKSTATSFNKFKSSASSFNKKNITGDLSLFKKALFQRRIIIPKSDPIPLTGLK